VISDFDNRLDSAYRSALAQRLWYNTYADSNKDEYWAEGVQSFFNVEPADGPQYGLYNDIDKYVGPHFLTIICLTLQFLTQIFLILKFLTRKVKESQIFGDDLRLTQKNCVKKF